MRDVLFVQGAGSNVHADWDIHLVDSLRRELGPQYNVLYPRMPNEAEPTLDNWRPVLEQQLAALRPGAVAVGHSVGGTILLNALANAAPARALGAIILIAAPFMGAGGWSSADGPDSAGDAKRLPGTVPVFLYHGEEDAVVPVDHVTRYAETMPSAHVRRLVGRDHQLNNDLTEVASDIRDLAATMSTRATPRE